MSPLTRQVVIRDCLYVSAFARLVAYELAARSNQHDQCRPSQRTIAKTCQISSRTVKRAIAELIQVKAIAVDYLIGHRARYTLTLSRLVGFEGATQSLQKGHTVPSHRSGIKKSATAVKPRQLQEACVVCRKRTAVLDRKCSHCINRHAQQTQARTTL